VNACFAPLFAELARWPRGEATFWWRDDDAVSDTERLRELLALSREYGAPLALAVVPLQSGGDLARILGGRSDVRVWQHGYAHVSHAEPPARKAELGDDRPWREVIGELESGRQKLSALFGDMFEPVIVPPWNRIGPLVRAALPAAGFDRLSTVRARAEAPGMPRQVNVHADPIDWRGTRKFIGEDKIVASIAGHLEGRRLGKADRSEPTGILSHHLSHDRECWDFLAAFLGVIGHHPSARLLHPDDLPW
jgi:hypothetical protein